MKRIVIGLILALAASFALAQQSFRVYPEAQKGYASYIRGAPSYIDARVLAANVNETITIPAGANAVIFSATCASFYAKIGATATVPAGDVTDGTASELNPASWFTGAATQIGIIAPATCTVTLTWYTLLP